MDFEQEGAGLASQNFNNSAYSVMSYDEWLHDYYNKASEETGLRLSVPRSASDYSVFGNFSDWLTGSRTYYEKRYQDYLIQNQREYEQKQINDARKFQEYLESSKYQRMVSDLKKAGLNPYLAVQNGIGNSTVNPGSASYSTSAPKHEGSKKSNDGSSMVSSVINAAVRLIAAAIIAG